MAGEPRLTLIGNLVEDPKLHFTESGLAITSFRIANNSRYQDKASGEWKDGTPVFMTCNVWRQQGEHVADSLQRGMRVIVAGRLKQRSYETMQGEKRTVNELEADEVGPSLKNATAKVTKADRRTAIATDADTDAADGFGGFSDGLVPAGAAAGSPWD